MVPDGRVVDLRSVAADRAQARALGAVEALVGEAMAALDDVLCGDIDAIYSAHRAINRAVGITLDHRLRTSA